MRDHGSWSVRLGRCAGVEVRLHMFFIMFAAVTMLFGWQVSRQPGSGDLVMIAAVSLVVLLVSGLVHEFGHVLATRRLGGRADRIVLGPMVGLAPPEVPGDPRAEIVCHLSGPLCNLLLCAVCLPIIWMQAEGAWGGLLNPLEPRGVGGHLSADLVVRLAFWINWVMLVVNMLPVFPFDGGRAVRSSVLAFRPELGIEESARVVAVIAKSFALVLAICACLMWRQEAGDLVPAWFVLVMLSILVFFSAKHEERRAVAAADEAAAMMDLDEKSEWASEDDEEDGGDYRPPPRGPIARWLKQRRVQRLERQRELEAEEERRVDEILQRLHLHGMGSLSDEDRSLLNRVSARYRDRQRNPT